MPRKGTNADPQLRRPALTNRRRSVRDRESSTGSRPGAASGHDDDATARAVFAFFFFFFFFFFFARRLGARAVEAFGAFPPRTAAIAELIGAAAKVQAVWLRSPSPNVRLALEPAGLSEVVIES